MSSSLQDVSIGVMSFGILFGIGIWLGIGSLVFIGETGCVIFPADEIKILPSSEIRVEWEHH